MPHNRAQGITWDWTPAVWSWSPADGRWRPEHGAPGDCVYLEVSTEGIDPKDSYDFWRETVFYNFSADRQRLEGASGFKARASALIAPRGEVYVYESDAISGNRTSKQARTDGHDGLDLGLVLSGERLHREREGESVAGSQDLFFYDATRSSRVHWGPHRGVHISLRRDEVRAALGCDVPPATHVTKAFATTRLSRFLKVQLDLFARQIRRLSDKERVVLLDHTIDLALSVLREAACAQSFRSQPQRGDLLAAALTFIARRLDDPDLDAVSISQELGCSRATLYRAFADRGLSVYHYIREARLQRAMAHLQGARRNVSIARLAQDVGYRDASNFGRAFRQRFGVSPSTVRERQV